VTIFSDGRPNELGALLSLPNVDLAPPAPAIVDMLCMARARVVVTSGISSFSMWAAFLGEALAINYPGTMARLNPERPGRDIEASLEGDLLVTSKDVLSVTLAPASAPASWDEWAEGAPSVCRS
jgi:hypothetical protein